MIIVRTPFRVSFLGGGTDLPAWYLNNKGAVVSATIDKYCYISARWLPPFFEHKHRIVWSKIELALSYHEISHPVVREMLNYFGIINGVEIHHAADLPAQAGMGANSSFTVALSHALHTLRGDEISKSALAQDAIFIQQERCDECVGSQDQTAAAYGGLNRIAFEPSGIHVNPLPDKVAHELEGYVMLFFTGFTHHASEIERGKIALISAQERSYYNLYLLARQGEIHLLNGNIAEFAKLVTEGWEIKRQMTPQVSTAYIDFLFQRGMEAGASGGKLLGAGGGGFLCFLVEPDRQAAVKEAMKGVLYVPAKFSFTGSEIILNNGK